MALDIAHVMAYFGYTFITIKLDNAAGKLFQQKYQPSNMIFHFC